jgi:hypothetical protein
VRDEPCLLDRMEPWSCDLVRLRINIHHPANRVLGHCCDGTFSICEGKAPLELNPPVGKETLANMCPARPVDESLEAELKSHPFARLSSTQEIAADLLQPSPS